MYILALTLISKGLGKMHELATFDHEKGNTWLDNKEHEEMKIVEKEIGVWKVCAPKIIVVNSPLFGDILKISLAMHGQCKQEKLLGPIPMQCNLNQACLYTDVTPDPNLCCELLIDKCTKSLRKDYHYPTGFSDNDTKLWLQQWGIRHTLSLQQIQS